MKIIKPSDNYLNKINGLFKNKYIIFNAICFNQYLNIEFINNKENNILLI